MWPGETEEEARERLAQERAEKRKWDERVNRTPDKNPAQVAASSFLATIELSQQERASLRQPLTELISEVFNQSPALQAIPPDQRDQPLWVDVARIAYRKITEGHYQESTRGRYALNLTVGLLQRKLAETSSNLWQTYNDITKSEFVASHPARKLGEPDEIPSISQRLRQSGLSRVSVDRGALIVDGYRLRPASDAQPQLIASLSLLRALTGKEPRDPAVIRDVINGQRP